MFERINAATLRTWRDAEAIIQFDGQQAGDLMHPAKGAQTVEQPEEAGGGEHHDGAEEVGQKAHLLLVRAQKLFLFGHGLGTSLRATLVIIEYNLEMRFVKKWTGIKGLARVAVTIR